MPISTIRTCDNQEKAVHLHWTEPHFILGGFALILVIIFALAAILERRWGKGSAFRSDIGSEDGNILLARSGSHDDHDGPDNLQARGADLSEWGIGSAQPRISFRDTSHQSSKKD